MINLPNIKIKIKGTEVKVKVELEGELLPGRSEWMKISAGKYLTKHPEFTVREIMGYLLWLLKDKDFVIFEFGGKKLEYVQFIKEGENLVFDFPYSVNLGNRRLMIDRVERILKRHGFKRFITGLTFNTLHYDDYCNDHIVQLQASFGIRRIDLAIDIVMDIASEIFRHPSDGAWTYRLGSQRD
jgi:hypothetical protein